MHDYSRNVKHIEFLNRVHPENYDLLDEFVRGRTNVVAGGVSWFLLPNVASVKIVRHGCMFPAIGLSLTPALRSVDINIGTNVTREVGVERSEQIANYLLTASGASYALDTLRMRGSACKPLNVSLAKLTTLRVLLLEVETCLVADTLAAIASFPMLEELTIDADHVNVDEFKTKAVTTSEEPQSFFPSLRSLKIRSRLALVGIITQHIQSTIFNDLDASVRDSQDSCAWTRFFSTIHTHPTIPNTLERLKIYNHTGYDDLDDGHILDNTPGSTQNDDDNDGTSNTPFSLNTISPLSKISNLRSFTLNTNLPLSFDDNDVDKIARWWPHLDSLYLGYLYGQGEIIECIGWRPKTTLACLASVARICRELRRLSLPVDVSRAFDCSKPPLVSQHQLRMLGIAGSNTVVAESTRDYIRSLFPALEDYYIHRLSC